MSLRRVLPFLVAMLMLLWLAVPVKANDDGGSYGPLAGAPSAWDGTEVRTHSMVGGSAECGTIEWSADLIKGRTDGMVVHAEHTVGCWTYKYTNLVGADREEMASNPDRETKWQNGECVRTGQLDVANHFEFYRDTKIDPSSVRVSCMRYSGPD